MHNKLTFNNVFNYGLPGLPLAMLGLPLFIYLPTFYNQQLGMSLSAVGLVLLLARSLDVVTDPIIGFLNDRYPQSKSLVWRRKSFILAGVPLLIIGLNFLLKPTENISTSYLFIWSFVTYLGWTLINIPWLAMGAEISKNYHEKSSLASSREIFSALGTVAVMSIPVILSIDSDLKATLSVLATILTILIPIALVPLLIKISLNRPEVVNSSNTNNTKHDISLFKLFARDNLKLINYPAVKKLLPAYFINSVANALPATLFILYVSYILQTPEKIGILLISYFLAAILGIPFWLHLARKTDKHSAWVYALYGSIAGFIWVPFIGQGDFVSFLMVCLATGFFLGADIVMPSSIQADISQKIALSEKHKNQNQTNSTALLFGLWGMITKLSLALAIGFAFPLLDIVGLQLKDVSNNATSENGSMMLIVLYAIIPIILKVWVIFQMRNFSFDKHYFSSNLSTESQQSNQRGNSNENTYSKTTVHPISNTFSNNRV